MTRAGLVVVTLIGIIGLALIVVGIKRWQRGHPAFSWGDIIRQPGFSQMSGQQIIVEVLFVWSITALAILLIM